MNEDMISDCLSEIKRDSLMYGDWVTEKGPPKLEAQWNTSGFVQVGPSRFFVDRVEMKTKIEEPTLLLSTWNAEMQKVRTPIVVEGTCEMTDAGKELFDTLRSGLSFTWSIAQTWIIHPLSPSKYLLSPSKQTRAFYRIRARAWKRRKVLIHAHKRWHRGNARG